MSKVLTNFLDIRTKAKQVAMKEGMSLLEFLTTYPNDPIVVQYNRQKLLINSTTGMKK